MSLKFHIFFCFIFVDSGSLSRHVFFRLDFKIINCLLRVEMGKKTFFKVDLSGVRSAEN